MQLQTGSRHWQGDEVVFALQLRLISWHSLPLWYEHIYGAVITSAERLDWAR